jgi:hypothetical protein
MRRCSWCKTVLDLAAFVTKDKIAGKSYVCADCRPEYNRDVWYRTTYGLSLAEVNALLAQQGSTCASCGDALTKFCVDHCHVTGTVRGILCHHCNVALGHLRDNPERIVALLALPPGR